MGEELRRLDEWICVILYQNVLSYDFALLHPLSHWKLLENTKMHDYDFYAYMWCDQAKSV